MILSASYNFFNGEEHLLQSIDSISDNVDYINIVYQKVSNSGNPISDEALNVLKKVKKVKKVKNLILYTPDFTKTRSENELIKRKIGLNDCLLNKCSHFFTIDADEFYRSNELEYAKEYIEKNNILSSSVSSFFHLKKPIWRAKDTTCCSFITKINKKTKIGGGNYYINNVDPTRTLFVKTFFANKKHFHFPDNDIAMYHMNFVRRDDLKSKLRNTSTTNNDFLRELKKNINDWEEGTDFNFPNKGFFKIEKVKNEFKTYSP